MLLKTCRFETTSLVPVLRMRSGLEVSTCTGHALRATLWEALCASFSRSGLGDCHSVGNIDCLSFCWSRETEANTIDQPATRLNSTEARRKLVDCIEKLSHTGVDSKNNLRAWWPFTQVELTCLVEGGKNRWVSPLKDTVSVSTFAVATPRCLQVRYRDN